MERSNVLDASRRIAACIQCQKQKVKCAMENGRPPCRRCKHRKVECIFKKPSSTAVVENTARYTSSHLASEPDRSNIGTFSDAVVADLMMVHSAVNELRAKSSQPLLGPLRSIGTAAEIPYASDRSTAFGYREQPNSLLQAEPENIDVDAQTLLERSRRPSYTEDLSEAPITSLYQITSLRSLRSQRLATNSFRGSQPPETPKDLISRGLLAWADAERLTKAYLEQSDHYLYGLVSKYQDLESIRRASPLLLVAICTVSALQEPSGSRVYTICHAELRRLVSNFVFTSKVDLEDFRGLCVACFWLSDMSWAISGLAIRRAVEFDLQKSFHIVVRSANASIYSTPATEAAVLDAIERVRLWYMFYICDHHLSVLYGRLPVIRDQDFICDWEAYLAMLPDSIPDRRITSQVALLRILNSVSKLFGVDVERCIPTIFKSQLDTFNTKLDQWVTFWLARYESHPRVGDYPSKAVTLHFYFAKLFVCSHVFRGLSSDVTIDPIPPIFLDTAYMAVESAKSIIHLVVEDSDLIASFAGVPHYFHTMIAFACSFLLKTATKYRQHIEIDVKAVFGMIGQVVALCENTKCAQFHLIHWIGEGLRLLLSSCANGTPGSESQYNRPELQHFSTNQPFLPTPDTTIWNAEGDGAIGNKESTGSVWDAACQAAMLYSTDHSMFASGYTQGTEGTMEEYSNQASSVEDFAETPWDLSMTHINLDHYGLGLEFFNSNISNKIRSMRWDRT